MVLTADDMGFVKVNLLNLGLGSQEIYLFLDYNNGVQASYYIDFGCLTGLKTAFYFGKN
jgi:hypothetical protein